ncbi:MAG: hypothetical protein HN855_08805 [Anaerolineae bacterium]|jgi:hypothetical protein|nr:hypothetical protein [Anaerolineae bacterium]MBT7071718.1 hypothetical protein [Anaerolineae bacterium]MBT7325244.1 hypothetical protein [Anaerolineae bacterium]
MKKYTRWASALLITLIMALLILWFAQDVGLQSITFAFWVNWLLMFWAYALHRTQAVSLPAAYYKTSPKEKKLHQVLGVRTYQRFIRRISIFNPELKLEKGKSELKNLFQATQNAELAHLLIFVIVTFFMAYSLLQGWWLSAFWVLFFNMLFNGYPVLVQRYNRLRINRLLEK